MDKELLYRESMSSIIQTARMHRRVMNSKMTELGLHHSQHMLLIFLSKHGTLPSQKEIAKVFDISPAAVTGTIKKLEQCGFVKKKIAQDDGRSYEISLTEQGRLVVEHSQAIFHEVSSEIFEEFQEDELVQLQKLHKKVQKNLKQLECRQREDELN